jgi:O-antigen/teichoic acid export membrane protein
MFLSVPFIAPTIVLAIKSVADRWILAGFLGVNELAGYSTLLQFGYSPVVLFFGMIQTFVAPKIYELCLMADNGGASQLKRYLQRMLAMISAGGFVVAIGSVLFGDWVFRILIGKEYFVLAIYLPFFVISGALTAMAGVLQIAVIGLFKPKIASVFSVIAISIGIACTAFLIRKSGFDGAVAGLLVSAGLMTLIYWLTLSHMPRRTHSQRNCQ